MKQISTLTLAFLLALSLKSQTTDKTVSFIKPNIIQIEFLGVGNSYSLNYERFISYKKVFKTSISIGGAYYFGNHDSERITHCITASINELYSIKSHHIEIDIGATYWNVKGISGSDIAGELGGTPIFLTGRVGYRYQKPDGHLMLKIAYIPFLKYRNYRHALTYYKSWAGVTIGYSF